MRKSEKRFTVVLSDEDLYKKIKIMSVERGTSMGKLIEDALGEYLNKATKIVINWPRPPSG